MQLNSLKNNKQIRKMLTASGGPIYWLRKRLYNNIEPFGYNDVGSRLIDAVVFNKNEHDNYKGNYSDMEKAPALYLTIDDLWREYLHVSEDEGRYSKGKYKIKNNGNGTFSLPFESMEDIMQAVNSNNPLLWGQRGKLGNSVVGEYDVHRGYDKNGDYLKYIDHWRINPYDVKQDKEYGLDNNSLLKWYFKGKDDASFGLGTPVEIQGKYYLDDIYNVKGKDRGGHYLPEVVVTGKKKQGGKMNAIEQFKQGSKIHIKKKNRGKFTAYCGGNVTSACIAKAKASGNPTLIKRATFAANARKWKHLKGGIIKALTGIILGPAPNITKKPIVKEILSYLPLTGSIIDTETAIKNPTLSNIGWAAWSAGSDIFGGRILRDLLKALKAYKETKAVTKAAEEALDTHRKTTKNIIARSVREEDQKLVNALQKARELEALKWGELYWNKAITYPVYGGWITNDAGINYLLNHKNGGIIKAEAGLSTSSFIDPMIVDYIKAIENPNRVGWNGKIWKAPGLKGYDLNLRGYGIDINTNNAARKLTAGRQGQWLTDDEANTLMRDHILYITNAANKHIKGFGELPIKRKAALLGMLYRGDSVNKSNINITEPDDDKFFNSVHNYYISKGLKERANNSSKFFKSYKTTPNFNFNNYKDLNYPFKYIK